MNIFNARDVAVTNCSFTHLGGAALVIANSSQLVNVFSNTFEDVSCGGLRVGQVGETRAACLSWSHPTPLPPAAACRWTMCS